MASDGTEMTFALVHGGWHGAWCFEQLGPKLEARGHRVLAMDLPCDDPTATFVTYADVVVAALEAEGTDVVLVGHSLGGYTIPLVAARRPVRRLVYLCSLIPMPGRSFVEQLESEPDMLLPGYQAGLSEPDAEGRRRWIDEAVAKQIFYADCDESDAHAAFERLRPQSPRPYVDAWPLDEFPSAARTYIVCDDDRIANPDWARGVARKRLDAELVELPGSHSPFLSRPGELADILHQCGAL